MSHLVRRLRRSRAGHPRFSPLEGRRAPAAAAVAAAMIAAAAPGQTCDSTGPDVIVGEVVGVQNYGSVGGVAAFAVGTTSCNVGDEELLWISQSTQHPVIGQNLFRLKDGRFEQVGQAWLKHGFAALQGNACACGCIPSGSGSRLGVGCSDPYGAGLNGDQDGLGPKFEVNAYTGEFNWVPTDFNLTGNAVYKRLQVATSDLDPALDGGGTYIVEAQYVTPDDSAAGNQYNNCSWREGSISGSGASWTLALVGSTHREEAAILAWEQMDPTVSSRAVDVRGDGRLIIAWKVTPLAGGQWNHEFALYNMNSDRGVGSFAVPLPMGASVSSTGFHDVAYHSGEPYDGTDWAPTIDAGGVSWATTASSVDPNANALRWGTLYNFRFVSDAGPEVVQEVEIGLFKPGGAGDPDVLFVPLIPNAPSNDGCESALGLVGGTTDFTTISATTDGPAEACVLESDIWFSYTAPCTGDVTISLCGSNFDTSLAVYTPGCPGGSGTAIDCNDDFCDAQSQITLAASAGESFLIRIGSPTGEQGFGSITVDCDGVIESNDDCIGAFPIFDGETPFDTTEATTDGPAHGSCQFDGQTYHDVWYAYTAEASGPLTVSTCNGAGFDTDLAVYAGCDCSNLVLLDCNDDFEGCTGFTSQVTVDVTAGSCYLIRVGGWNEGDVGTGTLTVTGPGGGGGGPQNDDCANPQVVSAGSTGFSTVEATTDGPDESCAVESDVWFRYTAPCTGDVTIGLCGSGFDTSLAIYDGDCPGGPGAALACNDDSCGDQSQVTLAISAGQALLIRVGSPTGEQGAGALTIDCDGVIESNDDCIGAFPIFLGATAFDTTEATTDGPAHDSCQFDGQTYHDVWYAYTATEDAELTVSTCGTAEFDTDLAVYDGCDCSNLVLLDCNDDFGSGCPGFTSQVTVDVTKGSCYLIRVGGWNEGDAGTGVLTLSTGGGKTGPPNDDCADAIDVNEETVAFSTVGATTDGPDEPGACSFFGYSDVGADVWYRYTASCAGTATVSLCDSGYDTKLAVYAGGACPTGESAIACNDDACGLRSEVTFAVQAGGQYLVRIGGYNAAEGSGMMTISCDGDTITDCNGNGIDDAIDIAKGVSEDCNGNDNPDECDIAKGVSEDCAGGPVGSPAIGLQVYTVNGCINCHGPDGTGEIGPDITNLSRVEIWNRLLPPTDHFGGEFPDLTQQDFADLEAFLDTKGGSGARPDLVPDECQSPPDCDGNGVSDACELGAGTQMDLDYDGVPDDCQPPCPGDVNDDDVVDVDDLTTVILAWGSDDPAADVNGDGIVDVDDLTMLILGWGTCP